MLEMFRQGDVLIVRHDGEIPKEASRVEDNILAHGEATGHAHRLNGSQLVAQGDNMFFAVKDAPAKITHEEHGTIEVPEGNWRVVRQQEYDPEQYRRRVAD